MGKIWELDFYSRPILDENKKKVWEVLICESPLEVGDDADSTFRYAQYCSSTQVNSVWLRQALEEAMAQSNQSPQKIRFFRTQMNNMITKACNDLGILVAPSRRTFTLNRWLSERMQEVYPNHPGFQANVPNPSVQMPTQAPESLPDALVGQQWAFVTLEASAFEEMHEWEIDFREAFPLKNLAITPDTKIPGLIIFSPRALPLAGWLSGLDLGSIKIDTNKRQVYKGNERIRLTGMEFSLLELLVGRSGKPFSRSEILQEVWGFTPAHHVDTRVVDVHVSRLRAKLEDDPSNPELILTERGMGYFFRRILESEED